MAARVFPPRPRPSCCATFRWPQSTVEAELTTPTGAAILAALATEFGQLPPMRIGRIGYGAGSAQFESQPNILRLVLGESTAESTHTATSEASIGHSAIEQIWILETQLDDTTGQVIGHCTARLLEAGALDVYTTAIQMKKNRPGVLLTAFGRAADIDRLEAILLDETPTLGVRRWPATRRKLEPPPTRSDVTAWGPIDGMLAQRPDGSASFTPEFETCRRVAEERKIAVRRVIEAAIRAFDPQSVAPSSER